MSPAKCKESNYINFLIATPKVCSGLEAARVESEGNTAHDAFTRLLHRLEPGTESLWQESETQVEKNKGILVLDDTTLDKLYAKKIALVTRHWSGKHHSVVKGINLITLLWTDGDRHIACDYRIYDKANDQLTKNDHFQQMIKQARERGFQPQCVVFNSWYAALENLKLICDYQWIWLTRLKENRKLNPERKGLRAISEVEIGVEGSIVRLEGYGLIRVFKIVAKDGDIEYWATNHLNINDLQRIKYANYAWAIENYHRAIKQFTNIERAMVRAARAQRNHINLALRAFLRIELHYFAKGISWFEAKTEIIRAAVRAYLANPIYSLMA
ncbi:MAG: transposase [Acidobacteriota bacterium]